MLDKLSDIREQIERSHFLKSLEYLRNACFCHSPPNTQQMARLLEGPHHSGRFPSVANHFLRSEYMSCDQFDFSYNASLQCAERPVIRFVR